MPYLTMKKQEAKNLQNGTKVIYFDLVPPVGWRYGRVVNITRDCRVLIEDLLTKKLVNVPNTRVNVRYSSEG